MSTWLILLIVFVIIIIIGLIIYFTKLGPMIKEGVGLGNSVANV
jgi:hypothetical protein